MIQGRRALAVKCLLLLVLLLAMTHGEYGIVRHYLVIHRPLTALVILAVWAASAGATFCMALLPRPAIRCTWALILGLAGLVSNGYYAVILRSSNDNTFTRNGFYNFNGNDLGITFNSSRNIVQDNNFSCSFSSPFYYQGYSISIYGGKDNKIVHNNIFFWPRCSVKAHWAGNFYWYGLEHVLKIQYKILTPLPMLIWSGDWRHPMMFNIDWHPARQPYDIPTMNEQEGIP